MTVQALLHRIDASVIDLIMASRTFVIRIADLIIAVFDDIVHMDIIVVLRTAETATAAELFFRRIELPAGSADISSEFPDGLRSQFQTGRLFCDLFKYFPVLNQIYQLVRIVFYR